MIKKNLNKKMERKIGISKQNQTENKNKLNSKLLKMMNRTGVD